MSIKFICAGCGHRLKANPDQAGKHCKCTRCGQTMTVPAPPPPAPAGLPVATPARAPWKRRVRRALGAVVAVAVVAGGVALAVFLYDRLHEVDRDLNDLAGGTPDARAAALLGLAEADPQDGQRARVTAALEPMLFEGDVRGNLDPDLLLRAYLHWAGPDNVPALIRMVDNPVLPSWGPQKTALVMATLGKLKDGRAAGALAAKLADPRLRDQAADALTVLGPDAQGAVLDYLFAADPAVSQKAGDLLAGYGTPRGTVVAAVRRRLTSNDPEARCEAAAWLAQNPPDDDAERADVAGPLAALLGDLSPRVNGVALRALKPWATRDTLPQVVEFARRQEKAGADKEAAANNSALIDLLARFPDEAAAEAAALRLKDPALRGKAAQALVQIGPAATGPVLKYLDHPDADVRKEARSLCRLLNVPADRQLDQTLADVADPSKPRARAALEHLAQLRPDEASRARVSKALNAPLLDPDATLRDAALGAVRVWATPDNAAALLKLLNQLPPAGTADDARTAERVALAIAAIGPGAEDQVIPLLKSSNGLVRRVACDILGEVGGSKSVEPLESAGQAYLTLDVGFYHRTQSAVAKITARQ
jgi:hypothetical protein